MHFYLLCARRSLGMRRMFVMMCVVVLVVFVLFVCFSVLCTRRYNEHKSPTTCMYMSSGDVDGGL